MGAALGFAALVGGNSRRMGVDVLCLGAALLVDGIDGTIARRLRVAEMLPRWSGDVLDLVVDFVTYVFRSPPMRSDERIAARAAIGARRHSPWW
jgi:phosphatidylcholine synthase